MAALISGHPVQKSITIPSILAILYLFLKSYNGTQLFYYCCNWLFQQRQVKTAVSKPRATSSPLESEEDERTSNRTSVTGKISVL